MSRFLTISVLSAAILAIAAASALATPPTIISPQVSGRTGTNGIINLHYTVPDVPNYGVQVTFTRESVGQPQTSFLVADGALEHNLTFASANPGLTWPIINSTGPILDGTYMVTVGYYSLAQAAYVAWEHAGVIVDSTTKPVVIDSPTTGDATNNIPLEFSLPEDQSPGSLKLHLTGAGTCDLTLADQPRNEPISIPINPASPASASGVASVASGCTIPDGTYTATLTYGDVWGNPSASTTVTDFVIDTSTAAPTLLSPATNDIFLNRVAVSYFLPEAADSGTPQLVFTGSVTRTITLSGEAYGNFSVSLDPDMPESTEGVLSGAAIPDGLYSVKLQYQDAAGNAAASSAIATNVRVGPVPTPPDTQSPVKPAGLAASSITQTSASLSWGATTDNVGVDSYHVFKDGVAFATTATTGVTVSLECGKSSNFAVSAEDAAGNESAQSTAFPITGAACDVVTPPTVTPPVTVAPKQCFTAAKKVSSGGKIKKKKVRVSLAGTPSSDGQRIQVSLVAPKSVKVTLTANGKTVKGPKVWILLTDGAQNVTAKVRAPGGTQIKPIKLALPKEAC